MHLVPTLAHPLARLKEKRVFRCAGKQKREKPRRAELFCRQASGLRVRSTQSEERQDGENDDDQANDIDDIVHDGFLSVTRSERVIPIFVPSRTLWQQA
jgi:hypothetical protein